MSPPQRQLESTPAAYRTEDGGQTWKRQDYENRAIYEDLRGGLGRLEFADVQHGLSIELNAMLFTRDGGRTWNKSRYCAGVDRKGLRAAEVGSDTWASTGAQLLDANYGWWTVEGDLFRTTDGGATWCKLPAIRLGQEDIRIHEIRFANREVGWVVPNTMGVGKLPVFESRDGGQSWKPVSLPDDVPIFGMSVVSETIIFLWGDMRLHRLIRD